MSEVIELARFRVDAENEEAFLAARGKMVDAVKEHFPGLRGLSLARLDDGTWVDVAFWAGQAPAAAAVEEAGRIPPVREWLSLIAEDLSMDLGQVVDRTIGS